MSRGAAHSARSVSSGFGVTLDSILPWTRRPDTELGFVIAIAVPDEDCEAADLRHDIAAREGDPLPTRLTWPYL